MLRPSCVFAAEVLYHLASMAVRARSLGDRAHCKHLASCWLVRSFACSLLDHFKTTLGAESYKMSVCATSSTAAQLSSTRAMVFNSQILHTETMASPRRRQLELPRTPLTGESRSASSSCTKLAPSSRFKMTRQVVWCAVEWEECARLPNRRLASVGTQVGQT